MTEIVRRFVEFLNRGINFKKYALYREFLYDYKLYRRATVSKEYQEEQMKRQMMLLTHSLEKGMFFPNKKKGWGMEKAMSLCLTLDKYNKKYGVCEDYISAVNVLNAYKNDETSNKNIELLQSLDKVLEREKSLLNVGRAGIKKIQKSQNFNREEIQRFFQTRCSIREFSDGIISESEIQKAMELAYTTPSACNRQSSKVYVITDKKKIKDILDAQLGDQGWCLNASTLFLVTGNTSYFSGINERNQVYIDGGMFAMNFVMGLHLVGIASCYKMFLRNSKLQNKVLQICEIPDNEIPIVFVLAGHYKNDTVSAPVSYRIQRPVIYIH